MNLTVGLIGAGRISQTHLAAWRRAAGCEVRGIFDLRPELARARAAQFALPRVYADAGALVEDCAVVDICTPPAAHAALLRQALTAGRHVLVEKPVVTRLEDWEELRGALERSDARLAVIHNLKYCRAVRRARAWLAAGRIGRLTRLRREFLTSLASDRMLGGHHWSHDLPGGRWFETLPHELYLVHHLLGPLAPVSVTTLRTADAPAGAPADEVTVVLRDDDALADIHYSASCGLNRRQLTLWGTRGRIHVDLLRDTATLDRRRDSRWHRALGSLPEAVAQAARWPLDRAAYLGARLRGQSPHALLIAEFARHLQGAGPPPTPLAEIDYVVRTADRIGREIDRQVRGAADG